VVGIYGRRINWILDADIRAFFDSMSHASTSMSAAPAAAATCEPAKA
jgi:hypothetical protein